MIRPVFGKYLKPVGVNSAKDHFTPKNTMNVHLYPNPVRDRMHVALDKGRHQDYTYSIMDMRGRTLIRGKRLKPILYLGNLASGIYILQFRDQWSRLVQHKKIVISR